MAASGDAFRKQHDLDELDEPKTDPAQTPEDLADEENEGGEIAGDVDKIGEEAGLESGMPIDKEVNKDEMDRHKAPEGEEEEQE